MNNFFTISMLALLSFGTVTTGMAQCTPLNNAIVGITMDASNGGTNNRSGLVYNPNKDLYYSVNAGSSDYPIDVYNSSGSIVDSVTAGFDYRGAWWNPAASQFEGNAFSGGGIIFQTLDAATGIPLGSGGVLFPADQPDDQSVGDLDYDANEIIYYSDGFVHRYSRVDNSFLGQYLITNLPVGKDSINTNSIVYTGCETREIGVYDFVNKRLLFVNKATGEYNGFCQLPPAATDRSSFGMSYANDLFWLFDGGTWNSYQVVSIWATDIDEELDASISLFPNPAKDVLTISFESDPQAGVVDIFSIQGQLIHSQSFHRGEAAVIELAGMASGTYFARIQTGEAVITRKFLKE